MGHMSASDLSAALWQERRQLEILLFRLETQRLHVVAGNLEWLNFMASEIETVLDRLRFEALARSVESAAVAAQWDLPAQTTLVELIAAAPAGPWPEILRAVGLTPNEIKRVLPREPRNSAKPRERS